MEHFDDAVARPDMRARPAGRRRAGQLATETLGRPDARQAGREVVGALMGQPAPTSVEDDWWASEAAAPVATPTPIKRMRMVPSVGVSTTVRFPPKSGIRSLMSAVLLLANLATAGAAYLTYDNPTTFTVGATATFGVLALVVWGIRAGTPVTHLAVEGGQLEVRQGGLLLKFDLSSHYTPIKVLGVPGRRGWRVLFGRGTMRPFIVDSSIVDPHDFMDVLRRYRPGD